MILIYELFCLFYLEVNIFGNFRYLLFIDYIVFYSIFEMNLRLIDLSDELFVKSIIVVC